MELDKNKIIGKRVIVGNDFGTVRYFGPIADFEGNWCGIEWDDPSRGKHDGCANGFRYFHTSSPTGASFVRESAVDFGKDMLECIRDRFIDTSNLDEFASEVINGRDLKIQICGLDWLVSKLQHCSMEIVSFFGEHVSSINFPESTAALIKNVTYLDLRNSLLNNWDEIFELLNCMRRLESVFLGSNRIIGCPKTGYSFPGIKVLGLFKLNYDWMELRSVFIHFPNLEVLDVAKNLIKCLSPLNTDLPLLKKLTLDYNYISDWQEINKLQFSELLQTLSLSNNPIEKIELEDCTSGFRSLQCLILKECPINDWSSIDSLNKLIALKSLVISDTCLQPVLKADIWTCLVARLPNIELLNRTVISKQERTDCERYLLTQTAIKMKQINIPIDKSCDKRIKELIDIYGLPETNICPQRLDWGFVNVKIINKLTEEKVDRRLPLSMTILLLETMICHLFKIQRHSHLELIHINNFGMENPLSKKRATIQFYEISDGDKIVVLYETIFD